MLGAGQALEPDETESRFHHGAVAKSYAVSSWPSKQTNGVGNHAGFFGSHGGRGAEDPTALLLLVWELLEGSAGSAGIHDGMATSTGLGKSSHCVGLDLPSPADSVTTDQDCPF